MVSSSTHTLNEPHGMAPVTRPPQEAPSTGPVCAAAAPIVRPAPHPGPQRRHLMQWLQGSLSTELVCVLRGHEAPAQGQGPAAPHGAPGIAPFMSHSNGRQDLDPPSRPERRRPVPQGAGLSPEETEALKASLRATLVAERMAVETYRQVIALIADPDDSTRRMVEALLADELEHVAQLEAWLADN